eukprot:1540604-Pyramimonas_sp.AAC.1
MKVLEGVQHAHTADVRDWPAWWFLTWVVSPPARAQGFLEFDMRRERPVWHNVMTMLGNEYGCF